MGNMRTEDWGRGFASERSEKSDYRDLQRQLFKLMIIVLLFLVVYYITNRSVAFKPYH